MGILKQARSYLAPWALHDALSRPLPALDILPQKLLALSQMPSSIFLFRVAFPEGEPVDFPPMHVCTGWFCMNHPCRSPASEARAQFEFCVCRPAQACLVKEGGAQTRGLAAVCRTASLCPSHPQGIEGLETAAMRQQLPTSAYSPGSLMQLAS